jgi:glycosyltransferase involved in cell wall biosynthesis
VGSVPKTVVVVPCYNEERRLATDAFVSFANRADIELLFVDDGSRDGTAAVIELISTLAPKRVAALQLAANLGKGGAVQAGLLHAIGIGAEVVGYLDADLSTPLEELERLIEVRATTGVDAVLGSRVALVGYDVRRSAVRHYLGRVFATAASLLLRLQIYDTQCGAKVFRVGPALERALATPFRTRWVFDLELLMRLRAVDPEVNLLEVPLRRWRAVDGSKLTGRQMLQVARDLVLVARIALSAGSSLDPSGREARTRRSAGPLP